MKTHKKPKTDNTIRREAEVALSKLDGATRELTGSSQEEADELMTLLRECQKHISEMEFVARKGYAIMKRAEKALKLPSLELPSKAMPLADFQKEVKRQEKAFKQKATESMKKIVDADYALLKGLDAVADAISSRITEAAYRGFALN